MKSLYISGGWGYGNKGDNAILEAMLTSIKDALPYHKLIITSYSSEELLKLHDLNSIESVHRLFFLKRPATLLHWLALAIWVVSGKRIKISKLFKEHISAITQSEGVILGGGGYFNDAWRSMLYSKYLEIYIAAKCNKPIMIYGQTIGPFKEATIKKSLTYFLSKVSCIAYRDIQSREILLKAKALEKSVLTADEVNMLPRAAPVTPDSNTTIGLMIQNLRPHSNIHGPSTQGLIKSEDQYINEITDAIQKTITKLGNITIKIIPSTSWDEGTCEKVYEKLLESKIDVSLEVPTTAKSFIDSCQHVDLMVSTNMHPIIIATTNSKPSIALSYHYKLDDYMASIGLENNNLRIDNFTGNQLAEKIVSSLQEAQYLNDIIKSNHHKIRNLAETNSKLLIQLMQ